MAKHWSEKRGWLLFPRQLRYTNMLHMMKGKDVRRWQSFLHDMHCGPRHIDGIFGPDTEQCSRKYLVRMGLMGGNHYCIVKRWTRYRLYLMYWFFNKLYSNNAPIRMALPESTYYRAGKDASGIMREMGVNWCPIHSRDNCPCRH